MNKYNTVLQYKTDAVKEKNMYITLLLLAKINIW